MEVISGAITVTYYYHRDALGSITEVIDENGTVVSAWPFDPDGLVLEGTEGPVSHLNPRFARDDVCKGVYDWSTGLIYKEQRYFVPRYARG